MKKKMLNIINSILDENLSESESWSKIYLKWIDLGNSGDHKIYVKLSNLFFERWLDKITQSRFRSIIMNEINNKLSK